MTARLTFPTLFAGCVCLATTPASAAPFTFQPAGTLVAGSGKGLATSKVYAPGIRYPIEKTPSFPNSQVWGVGGSQGPKGSQCDAKNFSYPWWDNYCETRTWSMPLCPSGKGHQGQDIRAASCANKTWWAVATEDGTVTSIGTYSVYMKGKSGTTFRYLHMDPGTLAVKTGQKVSKGQKMGLVSNAFGGTPTSIHLHFDVEQFVAGVGTVFVSPYNSLVESYKVLVAGADPCAAKNCDDGEVCTKDTCAAGVCSHAAVAGPCDDGNACTLGDKCAASKCAAGNPKPCDDGKACTTDACSKGVCAFTNNSKACDDGDACTVGDACAGGGCKGGAAKVCTDGVACTVDTCAKGTCKSAPQPGTCDDKNPCTADTCDAAGCKHVLNGCDDGNPCTADSCAGGGCQHASKVGTCDDGDACTLGDTCQGAACAGTAKPCNDNNPCTADACANGLCGAEPQAGACDDGDLCTAGDACVLGACGAGAPKPCDDGLDCTEDGCASGNCVHTGAVQPKQPGCSVDGWLEVYDECGAGPTLEACPVGQTCEGGKCGVAKFDVDAGGAMGVDGDGSAGVDAGGGTSGAGAGAARSADGLVGGPDVSPAGTAASAAGGVPSSGCAGSRAAGSRGTAALLLVGMAAAVVVRARLRWSR